MVKWFIILLCNILLIWFVADFSYKSGAHDYIATATYSDTANNYVSLYMLSHKNKEEAIEFYESELDSNIEIHKWAAENKSALHGIFHIGQHKPNTEYYKKILEYREVYPSKNKEIISIINQLIESEDKTF
jgi:hypothetical protein